MKKAYFKNVSGNFLFMGFFDDAKARELLEGGLQIYSDDDLYKLIDAAKDALNNIPLDQK